ncbi:OLD family protein [Kineococcus sp. SYSU DK002]|uniref:hypothetical protein n=1 Tax=Kineococcus sp. SYSU DK002 TaxID=3383123 RepID=UPI003D7C4EF3
MARVAASLGISTNRARRLAHTALPAGFASALTGPRVVLVEGATDAAVFGALLDTPVLAVGGKHVLPLAVAVARAHGVDVAAVVLDGDDEHHRAHHGTRRVRDALTGVPVHVLAGDLEAALAGWAGFTEALRRTGSTPGDKDPAAYATAARSAPPPRDGDLAAVVDRITGEVARQARADLTGPATGPPDPSPGPAAG